MNKIELIGHLANMCILLDSQERMGLQRSGTLAAEFQARWNELKEMLKKEQEDEARKSEQQRTREPESGASVSSR